MNIFDYLNSKRGGALLSIYAAVLVILVLLFLAVWIVLHNKDAKDLPEHICYLFGFIIATAFGTNLAATKLAGTAPEQPTATPPTA